MNLIIYETKSKLMCDELRDKIEHLLWTDLTRCKKFHKDYAKKLFE